MSDPLRERFDRFDRDSNGLIDPSELSLLLDALGTGYTEAQVRATFVSIDTDGNGQINYEELRAWWIGPQRDEAG
jgi:Ca2+-binding EF-hand superfamily protein